MGLFKDFLLSENNIADDLRHAARSIRHSHDYGTLYWNQQLKKVLWVAADGDGYDPNDEIQMTPSKEIRRRFSVIPGVDDVEICDECSVKHGEGWVKISYEPDVT